MRGTMLLTLALAAGVAAPAAAQDFSWRGTVAPGKTLEIKGVNGGIRAVAATGTEVEVTATKRGRRSDPDEVKIQVVPSAAGVTICAVYPTPRRAREENACAPGDEGHMNTENNDVTVNFTVKVPAGVNYVATTVNGAVAAEGLGGDAELGTVNGDVTVEAAGVVRGSTVNGSIEASMNTARWEGELKFETVNGSITLRVPDGLNAELDASTVNGRISTDFPVTVRGSMSPRKLRGRIGTGGGELELETVNGSIEIRKR